MWLPSYATPSERLLRILVVVFAVTVMLFLIAPLFIIVPLSFSKDPFFTLPVREYSLRWYADLFGNPRWLSAMVNSAIAAVLTTLFATTLGTLAALGIARPDFPARRVVMALLISPMIVPIVIVAVGSYLFFGQFGLTNTRAGLVFAHTALATPFVVITVTATLSTYDNNLTRAAHSLGASGVSAFFRVTLPNILPGVISGAIFAFAISFDEVVVALFMTAAEQRTLPVQMFAGIRDQINPTIMAAATMLLALSITLFAALAFLSRKSSR
ncbi:ABC transporter permease [Phaeovulum sp.]|uniref:ABC transporter permease n=1 Tax=Phaeovulum sp. TaxID=2934796 RepID=UPI0039E5C9A0